MNSGYNPVLFTPISTARKQMSSNTPEFFFGGSQIPTAMRKPVPIPKWQEETLQNYQSLSGRHLACAFPSARVVGSLLLQFVPL